MRQLRNAGAALAAVSILLFVSACGGAQDMAFWEDEVAGLTSWSTLSPTLPSKDELLAETPAREITETVGARDYQCTVTTSSLTETPQEFVAIDPDKSIVWLGNMIQGKSHYAVGSLQELPVRERAPLKISIDLLRGDNSRIVEQPSLTTVQSAIGDLVETAVAAGHEAASTATYDWERAHSTDEAMLRLGFSGEYLGGSASASLAVETQASEKSYLAVFVQKAFTVSMELPAGASGLVNASFTPGRLDALKASGAIAPDNPPVYISSVTYGRMLIYRMTSSESDEKIEAAIRASYDGGAYSASGEMDAETRKTLSNAKISIATFGGNQSNLEALIRSGKLKDYFTGDTKLTSMTPISFELRSVADNRIADITRTTEYEVKCCNYVTEPIGERVTIRVDRFEIPGDCDTGDPGEIYGRLNVAWEDEAGKIHSTTLMDLAADNHVKVEDPGFLTKPGAGEWSATVSRIYGKRFRLEGQLMERDSGLKGADDTVGEWKGVNLPQRAQGARKATSNGATCYSGNRYKPTLEYTLTRQSFIYPAEE